VPKTINSSVGLGGKNSPDEVVKIQFLLDCVPAGFGGPLAELAIDGIAGPLTLGAIRRFQTAQFGKADGRVDPGHGTIDALLPFDPWPEESHVPLGGWVTKMPFPPAPFTPASTGKNVGGSGSGKNFGAGPGFGGSSATGKTSGGPFGKSAGGPPRGPGKGLGGKGF
jgi:peptidoglycan hydrolase-like protein with peptidoglycan-binding domain